jgi:hypothetical protein
MIQWSHYPRSQAPTALSKAIVRVFEATSSRIDSSEHQLSSNETLRHVTEGLKKLGFEVEAGKKKSEKIQVPVLFGLNGRIEKSFEADAYHEQEGYVLEVEAGRAVSNNQFLKDLFQACMMHRVEYLAIAVRNIYEAGTQKSRDFERVVGFFDTLYASNRLQLPLKGVLVIGY